ncbi:MAG: hypothetical protein U0942_10565 [Parvibaculum sp.]|jgi:hypothetical protein|uniref:hypothetical protein n=1 Tax=Parvibaculum sp. TaxID=2024848 RepID=UPI002ABB8634|nr:hypothetical protein [Parvibaculum sp.]MDZ4381771.1 hypothetical protein [Parvibaculum sp.]
MRTLKKSMLVLGSAVALGSIAMVAAPAPSQAANPCSAAASSCSASSCAASSCSSSAKPKFSRYGKR